MIIQPVDLIYKSGVLIVASFALNAGRYFYGRKVVFRQWWIFLPAITFIPKNQLTV